ncbi:MAG: sigma-70 family RNA polymerase sigma factor [Flavobacteriales bacterium]|nr:sigma-70 family RNA polymerase sigma factor [Flavobacteriales bacterium]
MFLRRKVRSSVSDDELVLALRGGHPSALGELWDRYAHLLFGVGMKYLKDTERSKDAVVEIFASLPMLLRKHRVERFRPWVHTVMRNHCLQALRGDRHDARVDDAPSPIVEDASDALLREASLERLEQAIGELNEEQRQCIRLFHLDRLSYQQTSERTGLPVEQVRSHLQNGRRNLRIILTRHADQDH